MIHKAQVDSNFVVIPNGLAQHRGISFELRGFLLYILSKPTHWKISIKDIQNEGGIGRDKVYKLISEGMKAGYIRRIQEIEGNKFQDVEYEVFPLPDFTEAYFTDTSNTEHIKERDIEKKESIKDSTGNDFEIDSTENNLTTEEHEWDIDAFEIWWRAYPRLVNKKNTKIAYMAAMKKTDCATLLRGAEEYARENKDNDVKFIKKPENWLNEELWDDYQPKVKRYLVGGQVREMSEELAKEIGGTEI